MNPTQLDELRDALRRETQHIHPVGLGLDAVQRRGRRRRNRGRTVVAVGAATCVAGLGVSVMERGAAPRQVDVGARAASAAATPALDFRVVDGTVSGSTTHFTTAAGVTYELSTAPGVAASASQPGQAIYGTSDGEHWTTADQAGAWISDLTARDGVLYAIGTAPGTAAGDVRYRVGASRDGGNVWSDTDLPFDLSAPSAKVSLTQSSVVHIASGPSATVAVLSEQFFPDLSALVAGRTAGNQNVMTRMTSAGYELVDQSGCAAAERALGDQRQSGASVAKARLAAKCTDGTVIGTISWSDLGLSGPGDLTRDQMLVSTDGTHWDSVPAPTSENVTNLVADGNSFLLLGENDNASSGGQQPAVSTTLLHSTDARVWTTVGTPSGLEVQAIAGDSILGVDASGAVQTSTDGGATWNSTSVRSLLPAGAPAAPVTASDAGPLGFAVLAAGLSPSPNKPTGHDYLLFSADGLDWTSTDLATIGEPTHSYPMQVTVGADHISVDYGQAGATSAAPMKITTLLATPKR